MFIEEKEIRFIRITNKEINTDINILSHKIKEVLKDSLL